VVGAAQIRADVPRGIFGKFDFLGGLVDECGRLLNVSQIFFKNLLNELVVAVDVFLEVLGSVDSSSSSSSCVHFGRSCLSVSGAYIR